MAILHIALSPIGARGPSKGNLAVPGTVLAATPQSLTTTASSVVATPVAPGAGKDQAAFGGVWTITARAGAGDAWVNFGPAPVAVIDASWLILAGQTREFVATGGDKVAVLTA